MTEQDLIYRRALWFMLPETNRRVYVEDLTINHEDFLAFQERTGRWAAPVTNPFDVTEEQSARYSPYRPVPPVGPELAYIFAHQGFEEEESGDEVVD